MAESDGTALPPRTQDLTGMRFERLTVIGFSHYIQRTTHKVRYCLWRCQCDCGATKNIAGGDLKRGRSKSCGCLNKELSSERKKKAYPRSIGARFYEVYDIYMGILDRCYKEYSSSYPNYGAMGITVCDRWRFGTQDKSGLECFVSDMGPRPSKKHSVDRRDGKKGYEPNNCHWATAREQAANRHNNVHLTYLGRTLILSEWARELGISSRTVWDRHRKGWTAERVLSLVRRPK